MGDAPTHSVVRAVAIGRVVTGIAAVLAPVPTASLFGFDRSELTPAARVLIRMFGGREIFLGAVTARIATADAATARHLLLLNIGVDAIDATAGTLVAVKSPTARRAFALIVPPAVASVLGHRRAIARPRDLV